MKTMTRLGLRAVLLRCLPLLPILLLPGAHAAVASEIRARSPVSDRTAPIDLGGAGHFVILSKSGITDVPASNVTGNVGVTIRTTATLKPFRGEGERLNSAP
jgi:hypothetical protein